MVDLFTFAAPIEGDRIVEARDLRSLQLGVGKAAAAASLALACAEERPTQVVLFGVCGVHRSSGLEPGDLCVVSANTFGDEGVEDEAGFRSIEALGLAQLVTFAADAERSRRLALRLGIPAVMASTVSTCSGTDARAETMVERTGALVETMEGAAVGLVCDRLGIPWVELRCVSNFTGDRSRGEWDLTLAAGKIQDALLELVATGFFDV